MRTNATNKDWFLEDKYESSDPMYCPVDRWQIRMVDEDIDVEFPSLPDSDMTRNSWIYEEPTVGYIVRLFPSYEGNYTIFVMGHTVGDQFSMLEVDFEITSCSFLTNDVEIRTEDEEYIFDFNKNTGLTTKFNTRNLELDTFRVTNGNCPIWKFDLYNRNGLPIQFEDDPDFGRVVWDEDHAYFQQNPWETFNSRSFLEPRYWPEFQIDTFVPLLDGETVFYWLNFTAVVESKGEVTATFPLNFRIRVCGNEILSRTPIGELYNFNTGQHELRLPIR